MPVVMVGKEDWQNWLSGLPHIPHVEMKQACTNSSDPRRQVLDLDPPEERSMSLIPVMSEL